MKNENKDSLLRLLEIRKVIQKNLGWRSWEKLFTGISFFGL